MKTKIGIGGRLLCGEAEKGRGWFISERKARFPIKTFGNDKMYEAPILRVSGVKGLLF